MMSQFPVSQRPVVPNQGPPAKIGQLRFKLQTGLGAIGTGSDLGWEAFKYLCLGIPAMMEAFFFCGGA